MTILIVDDQPSVRKFVKRVLSGYGYRLLEAPDGTQALNLTRKQHVDLLISDLVMPGINGAELAATLHEGGVVRRSVLISGDVDAISKVRFSEDMMFLEKPFSPQELVGQSSIGLKGYVRPSGSRRHGMLNHPAPPDSGRGLVLRDPAGDGFEIDIDVIEHDPSVIFILDGDFRFRFCNLAWDRFALENDGAHLTREAVVGRPIFDFVSSELIAYYGEIYREVLRSGVSWRQDYECSSPAILRRFAMHVHPIRGELLVVNSLRVQEPHADQGHDAIERNYRAANGLLVMCSNCRRARANAPEDRWDWVPGFVSSPPIAVSHGICPPCSEYYFSKLDNWRMGPI